MLRAHCACLTINYVNLEQGSRRRYRRLFAEEGEGGGNGNSAGCFPDFYSPQDFQDWLQGNYQSAPSARSIASSFLCCCGMAAVHGTMSTIPDKP